MDKIRGENMEVGKEDEKLIADLELKEAPAGVDRRRFLMRSATIGAAAVLTGCTTQEKTAQVGGETPAAPSPAQAALAAPPLDEGLEVVKKSKGPVMTLLDEFYKVGPGPSSSHTIGVPLKRPKH
jgi:L-serine dehydratase